MLERFSDSARKAVGLAEDEAGRLGHQHIGTEHLLLGLLAEGRSPAADVLRASGATLEAARHKVAEAVGARPGSTGDGQTFTPRATRALERASRFSFQRLASHIGTEHVLLGVLDVEGTACQVLRGLGVDVGRLRTGVDRQATDGPAEPEAEVEVDAAPAIAADPETASAAVPSCPTCAKPLTETLAHRVLPAAGEQGTARDVVVVFCSACGSALGAASIA